MADTFLWLAGVRIPLFFSLRYLLVCYTVVLIRESPCGWAEIVMIKVLKRKPGPRLALGCCIARRGVLRAHVTINYELERKNEVCFLAFIGCILSLGA